MVNSLIVHPSEEQRELAALEDIFEDCREAWEMASEAIKTIRDRKLFKAAGYKSWEEYCPARWKITSHEVNQRIRNFEIFNKLTRSNDPGIDTAQLKQSHLKEIGGWPEDMHAEILQTAQQTAPGGKLTAGWINQVGQRLMEARRAAMNEAAAAQSTQSIQAADDEEEEEDNEEEEVVAEEVPVPAPARPRGNQAIQDAAAHPITMSKQIQTWEAQAKRTVHKLERLALSLNCTPQDLLERFGS